jgi:hypothetical protein
VTPWTTSRHKVTAGAQASSSPGSGRPPRSVGTSRPRGVPRGAPVSRHRRPRARVGAPLRPPGASRHPWRSPRSTSSTAGAALTARAGGAALPRRRGRTRASVNPGRGRPRAARRRDRHRIGGAVTLLGRTTS